MKKLLSILVCLVLMAGSIASVISFPTTVEAVGNTYHVSQDFAASDANGGSNATSDAWASIQKALTTAIAGDTVYIHAGTYAEELDAVNSGAAGNYITFIEYPGDTVVVDCAGIVKWEGILKIWGKSYLKFVGIDFINGNGTFYTAGVFIGNGSDHITIQDAYITNTSISGIYAEHSTNITIDGCDIHLTNVIVAPAVTGNQEMISLENVNGFEVKNCIVRNMGSPQRCGIDAKTKSSNGSIHDNEVYDTYVGIYVDARGDVTNIDIYNNYVHDNPTGIALNSELNIQTIDSTTDTTHLTDSTLTFADDHPNGRWLYNVTRAAGSIINDFDAASDTVTLASAIVGMIAGDTYYIENDVLNDIQTFNNLLVDNDWGFSYNFGESDRTTFINSHCFNNTFYSTTPTGTIATFRGLADGATFTTCKIFNNIIYSTKVGASTGIYDLAPAITPTNNLYYAPAGAFTDAVRIAAEIGAVSGNPLFVTTGSNFALQSGSPAKDVGTAVSAPSTDYIGTSRPYNMLYDIGAYEFTISTSSIAGSLYKAGISIANAGAAASNVSTVFTLNTADMITAGFANGAVTDVSIRSASGADVAFMPGHGANPWVLSVPSITANGHDTNFLYTSAATGGNIRYFPGSAGVTTNDAAALELGNDFSIETKGYVDTASGSGKYIFNKPGALTVDAGITTAGKITATYYKTAGIAGSPLSQSSYDTDVALYGASYRIFTQTISSFVGRITSCQLYLYKVGSPTGNVSVKIYNAATNTEIGTLGTIDSASLTGVVATYTFSGTPVEIASSTNILLGVEYTGGDVGNLIRVKQDNFGNAYATSGYSYSTGAGWQLAQADLAWANLTWTNVIGKTLDAAVASGEHTVKVYADTANFSMDIDGINVDSEALGGTSVLNNANNIVMLANGAMPYVEYSKVTVGGTLKQHLAWQYGATLTDQSGLANNPASVSFLTASTDADVTAIITSFQPITEAKAPAVAPSGSNPWINGVPVIGGTFISGAPAATFPGASIITAIATATSTPAQIPMTLIPAFIIIMLSLALTKFLASNNNRSTLIKAVVIASLIGLLIATKGFDFWMLLFFLFPASAVCMASSQQGRW